jgi:integrase
MTKRRGAHEGAIYRDKTRLLWVGVMELGVVDGKRVRKVVRSKDKPTVLAKLRAMQIAADKGLPVPDQTATTGAWLEWWGAEALPGTVKDRTAEGYRAILARYVIPHIGKVPLTKLGPEQVLRMMQALDQQGLSPRTRAYARAVLRRSLGQAERWGKVSRNAAALVDAPRKAASKLDDALDADQAVAVLSAAAGARLEALAVLVLAVGLRRGEALRLRWADIDLDAGTLTVTEAKTDAGRRTIALPAFVVAALRAHRARQLVERVAAKFWQDPGIEHRHAA